MLERNKIDMERILNDPPRDDFDVPVRARPRRFHSERMATTDVEVATAEWTRCVLLRCAYLEAAVRAEERAQKGRLSGARNALQRRLDEGRRATERARDVADLVVSASRDATLEWATALERGRDQFRSRDAVSGLASSPVIYAKSVLSPDTVAYVKSTGLVINDLSPVVSIGRAEIRSVDDLPQAVARRFRTYAATTQRSSRALAQAYGHGSGLADFQ